MKVDTDMSIGRSEEECIENLVTLYNTVTLICINSCLTNPQIIMS